MRNKKKHICFFSPASYAFFSQRKDRNYGGAELQMYTLAKGLSINSEFDISFFVASSGQKKIMYHDKIKLIHSFNLPQKEHLLIKLLKAIRFLLLLIQYRPDIIITTTANSIVGITAFFSIILKIKHIHRTASIVDVNLSKINKTGFFGKIYKYGLEKANTVITQTSRHKELLLKNHNIKAEILKNAFEIDNKPQDTKEIILWVGRFVKLKKPDIFLKLADHIPDNKFVIICPYNKDKYKEWKILQQKAAKINNVEFIEKVAFNQIQDYFNKARLFINTSDFEGFPNTFLQAAQSKTPIISLNVNPDNFITEYNCGIFCNNNYTVMEEQTKILLKNNSDMKIKGENAYKYIKENHNIHNISKQLKQIILKLL